MANNIIRFIRWNLFYNCRIILFTSFNDAQNTCIVDISSSCKGI